MLEQIIFISSALLGYGTGKVELPLSIAVERIDSQLSDYCAETGIAYGSHVNPIFGPLSEVTGFEIVIDGKSLAFDLEGYSLNPSLNQHIPERYSSFTAGMTALTDLESFNGFSIDSCICQIPSLVSLYGASFFGNWNPVSFKCGDYDCAQVASADLIYTYRLSNYPNPSIYSSPSALYSALQTSQNYQPEQGVALSDFLPGLNAALSPSYHATYGLFSGTKPVVCAYSPASGSLGHFAMKIGEAETTAFWLIKTKWDIVVSKIKNYIGPEPNIIDSSNETCFFGIEANRRQATFVISGC